MDVLVTAGADRVMIQRFQKQGFPTSASPVPPPSMPAEYMFYAKDRLIGFGLFQGDRAEFLRRPDGTVGWIRVAGASQRAINNQAIVAPFSVMWLDFREYIRDMKDNGIHETAGGLVVSNPEVLGGKPVFRGTRMPVSTSSSTWLRDCLWITSSKVFQNMKRVLEP